ncbi:MAG TPA: hypothetical protein VEB88_05455 [Candidatus Acidoferrales bacterium]|nr:hypothetical protein [Candidatus Acidoferrales bacterium]
MAGTKCPKKKESLALRFAAKFWGLTPCLLELTIALLLILSKYFEASVVFGLLIFNSILAMPKRRTLMPRNVISFGA